MLDTHVLVWLDEGSSRLGPRARAALERAFRAEELAVSAISFWEIAMLQRKGRLELDVGLGEWRAELLRMGVVEVPVSGRIGILAAQLENFHGDPADRMIVATARSAGAPLLTADERILDWAPRRSCRDARR